MKDVTPQQALGVILLLLVVGAGATAGVTLVGSVSGRSVTTVNQAVVVPQADFNASNVDTSSAVVSVDDKGTTFAVGAEAFQGETYDIGLPVNNHANGEITVELVLKQVAGPDPISIDVDATGNNEFAAEGDTCEIAHVVQSSTDTWRFKLGSTCKDRVNISISIQPDANPGFYKVKGSIKPLEGLE